MRPCCSKSASVVTENNHPSALSEATGADCSLCHNLNRNNMFLEMRHLLESASARSCPGCQFLYMLSHAAHSSIYGYQMSPGEAIWVNCNTFHPPKELLIISHDGIISQHGKVEVFKTLAQGTSTGNLCTAGCFY